MKITPEQIAFFNRQAMECAARASTPEQTEEVPDENFPSVGTLRVQVFSAQGAFPVTDAEVTVSSGQELLDRRRTDSSGIVENISLPARAAALSQDEATAAESGMKYTVTVTHPDYDPQTREVEVYAGTETLLPVDMIPVYKEAM